MKQLKLNQTFEASHKLTGTIIYRYLGEEETSNGYNIKLLNLADNNLTYVEPEWFNQRKIIVC